VRTLCAVTRIQGAGARTLITDAPFLFAGARILVTEARILVTHAAFLLVEARILVAVTRILVTVAPCELQFDFAERVAMSCVINLYQ